MTTLTHSEAQAYCIGVAQVIPVFLIVMFVIDSRQFMRFSKKAGKLSVRGSKGIKKSLAKTRNPKKDLIRNLVRIDSLLIGLELNDPPLEAKERREGRARLIEMREIVQGNYDEINRIELAATSRLNSSAAFRANLDATARRTANLSILTAVLYIVSGIIGELVALWGAAGLIEPIHAMSASTDLAIVSMAFLVYGALNRTAVSIIRPESASRRRFSAFMGVAAIVILLILCGVAQITYVWMVASLKVVH